jgi:hypothetical protein
LGFLQSYPERLLLIICRIVSICRIQPENPPLVRKDCSSDVVFPAKRVAVWKLRCGKRPNHADDVGMVLRTFRVFGIDEPAKQIDAHCLIGVRSAGSSERCAPIKDDWLAIEAFEAEWRLIGSISL